MARRFSTSEFKRQKRVDALIYDAEDTIRFLTSLVVEPSSLDAERTLEALALVERLRNSIAILRD